MAVYQPPHPPTLSPLPVLDSGVLDASRFAEMLAAVGGGRLVTEAVFRPNSLVRLLGAVEAIAEVAGDFGVLVTPVVTWKKAVLGSNSSDKAVSIARCRDLWPTLSLKRTPRATTDSHDFAESALLAYYGYLLSQRNDAQPQLPR